ncbi:uncharacterized protein HMPREF1541_01300 [Cyphellophora europaea CBS 101466]|uniref:Zn(2)-C6 fungal-type domain-containing protein n=1 Tax=Cyphellophora europaea (strain CBS 101466) TaxID=1220924 RepID=W2SEQ1_CYPE1|nr:uncharacterized protein HMPREF1541_01300 [Cyphellophora europaea CBS 101466]ETN47110.1 hypothetical protein HMPREF1541_01300 [Cyphellophora europaea CBS 101466]
MRQPTSSDPSPHQRHGSTKSRGGCLTCKARRVKCDETQPQCHRCRKARLTCKGYSEPAPKVAAAGFVHYVVDVDNSLNHLPDIDQRERRALVVFHQSIGPELARSFAWALWARDIPLVAVHHDATRHAVIALSTVYEQYFLALHQAHAGISVFALEQYSKALCGTMKLTLRHSAETVEVALLNCLLFAAIENLQGHYRSAMTHMDSGLGILAEYYDAKTDTYPEVYVPRVHFRQAFVRIESQRLEMGDMGYGQAAPHLVKCVRRIPAAFQSLTQATLAMNVLVNRTLLFMQDIEASSIYLSDGEWRVALVLQRRRELLSRFEAWCHALNNMQPDNTNNVGSLALLEFYRTYLGILLRVDLRGGQVGFEALEKEFQDMVILASLFISSVSTILPGYKPPQKRIEVTVHSYEGVEHVPEPRQCPGAWLGISPDSTPVAGCDWAATLPEPRLKRPATPLLPRPGDFYKPSYSVGLSIIEPLLTVCIRCRNPRIRQQALQLLKMCNRKEGIWDSLITATVAERMIELEDSQGADAHSDGGTTRFLIANMQAFYVDSGRAVVYYAKEYIADSAALSQEEPRYQPYVQERWAF